MVYGYGILGVSPLKQCGALTQIMRLTEILSCAWVGVRVAGCQLRKVRSEVKFTVLLEVHPVPLSRASEKKRPCLSCTHYVWGLRYAYSRVLSFFVLTLLLAPSSLFWRLACRILRVWRVHGALFPV